MAQSGALSRDFLPIAADGRSASFTKVEMATSKASLEIARSIGELRALEQEWRRLEQQSDACNPFLSFDWTLACWTAKDYPAELFVATIRDQCGILALAPLCVETRAGLKILRFIAHERSDYLGFLIAGGSGVTEQSLLNELVFVENEWDLMLLEKLTPSYSSLLQAELSPRYIWHRTKWTSAPYCVWEGDWDSLHKHGPTWLKEARRRSRRFFGEGYRVECFTGAEAAERVVLVSEIEARSWKGRMRSTRFQPGSGADLLRRIFDTSGPSGAVQLWLAFAGDRAIAFHIYFVLDDRLWHYQTAYDEEFGHTRAGSIGAYVALESAWKRGIREFDYLSGDEPYKLKRSNASRGIYHLAGHPRTVRGRFAYHALIAPRWRLRNVSLLKAIYKRTRSLHHSTRKRAHG